MSQSKKIEKQVLKFNAMFLEEEDGGYSVSVPVLPGCFSQGETFEKAVDNIKEAIELYLEDEEEEQKRMKNRGRKEFLVPVELYG